MAVTLALVRWQSERMAGADTRLLAEQTSRQIAAALEARRRSVSFFRDALDKTPPAAAADRTALARSAAAHTPHEIGSGWIDRNKRFHWWVRPSPPAVDSVDRLDRQIWRRIRWRDLLSLPSTFAVAPAEQSHAVFAVVEPFRARWNRPTRLVVLFDLDSILQEALESLPAQVLEADQRLYRSEHWRQTATGTTPRAVVEVPLLWEGNRWILQTQRSNPALIPVQWFTLLAVLCLLLAVAAAWGMIWTAERLRELATTDELTGLYNRRFFFERWDEEMERAQRYGRPLACLLIDLNGFKRVNDLMGHSKGDQLLREAAQRLQSSLRQSDVLARWGGDEFVVALSETDYEKAGAVAGKLRSLTIPAGVLRPLGLSVGVAQARAGDSVHGVIQRADIDLYSGKPSTRDAQNLLRFAG